MAMLSELLALPCSVTIVAPVVDGCFNLRESDTTLSLLCVWELVVPIYIIVSSAQRQSHTSQGRVLDWPKLSQPHIIINKNYLRLICRQPDEPDPSRGES